jgi:hypothetical protein
MDSLNSVGVMAAPTIAAARPGVGTRADGSVEHSLGRRVDGMGRNVLSFCVSLLCCVTEDLLKSIYRV